MQCLDSPRLEEVKPTVVSRRCSSGICNKYGYQRGEAKALLRHLAVSLVIDFSELAQSRCPCCLLNESVLGCLCLAVRTPAGRRYLC